MDKFELGEFLGMGFEQERMLGDGEQDQRLARRHRALRPAHYRA